MRVKICGVTRPEDAREAVAAGADALGFVFAPRSRRVLDAERAAGLVRGVPAFVCRVGLFMDQDFEEIRGILDRVPLNLLQFHGSEAPAFCRRFGLPYIKALAMGSVPSLQRAQREFADAAALLLDSHRSGEMGGTGQTFDWGGVPSLDLPLVLAECPPGHPGSAALGGRCFEWCRGCPRHQELGKNAAFYQRGEA